MACHILGRIYVYISNFYRSNRLMIKISLQAIYIFFIECYLRRLCTLWIKNCSLVFFLLLLLNWRILYERWNELQYLTIYSSWLGSRGLNGNTWFIFFFPVAIENCFWFRTKIIAGRRENHMLFLNGTFEEWKMSWVNFFFRYHSVVVQRHGISRKRVNECILFICLFLNATKRSHVW